MAELKLREEARALSGSLYAFLKAAWKIVEPARYVDNWHVGAYCEHLEAVSKGQIRNLIINVPPRHQKSLTVSVFWPCWTWTFKSDHRFLFTSYAETLSLRDSLKCRDIIKSEWYLTRWPEVKIKADQDQKTRFDLMTGGYRIASSVGGSTTGEGADTIVVDDPHALDDAYSDANREAALRWWSNTMSSRLNDRQTGSRVVIMQRIHESDLSGHILKNESDWTHLCLPAEYVPTKTYSNSLGWKDPRKEAGELLWPAKFPRDEQNKIRKETGSYTYSGQQQQDPQPAEGGMFAAKYFRYFAMHQGEYLLRQPDGREKRILLNDVLLFQTFDTAIKVTEANDWTVCLTAGITPENDLLILDVLRSRIPVPEQFSFTTRMRLRFPNVSYQFVEDKGSGQGLIQEAEKTPFPFLNLGERLKQANVPSLISGDKQQRAVPVSILYENGKVYHLGGALWLPDFEHELTHFPVGDHDDMVDCAAYAGICLKYGPRSAPGFWTTEKPGLSEAERLRLENMGINVGEDDKPPEVFGPPGFQFPKNALKGHGFPEH